MIEPCLLLETGESQVTELAWRNPIAAWVLILIVVPLVVLFVKYVYGRERLSRGDGTTSSALSAGGPVHWLLVALRIFAILVIVALLAQPVLRTTAYQNIDSSVVVLVDDSLSMDIADKYSSRERVDRLADFLGSTPENVEATHRYDLVRRLLGDEKIAFLEKLRARAKVSLYRFAGSIQRVKQLPRRKEDTPPLAAADLALDSYDRMRGEERVRETRIGDAILDAVSSERGVSFNAADQRVAGVVLLSDGQQTPGGRAVEDVARRLGQQKVPVFTVGIGNPDDPKDIKVIHLDVSDIVLAGDLVPFDAAIVSEGYQDERVRVDLKLDNEIVATQYVVLEGNGRRQPVRLEHRPPRPGDFVVTVEVERKTGELFHENNSASRPMKVLDQKIKVLYADGPPRWEYRYLKNALIRDQTMQAQIFLFSADPLFVQDSSPGMPPLVRFPTTREEIFSYHVIIIGDVDVEQALTQEQIGLLKEFVLEAGGGIVLIAGENANPSKYLHSEFYSLLPVEVPERTELGGLGQAAKTSPFNVELTPVGREHTVLRLENDLERNLKLWENKDGQFLEHLPGFISFQEVGRARKGSVVLARHPQKVHPIEQKGLVVFAFMNFGKGRIFFSAVDDTWRWRAGVDNLYFYRFWGQVIRFCATGRLLGKTPRYGITTDKVTYTLGENVNIESRVFDANMKPSNEKTLTVYHQTQGGDDRTAQEKGVELLDLELDLVQGQGTYHGAMVANRLGLHDVWLGTETERFAFRTFEVVVPAVEMKDPRRNQALLENVATLSGGAFFEMEDILQIADRLAGESQSRRGEEKDDPLWDELWLVLAFTGLIAMEWILRKMVHLL